MQETRHDPQVAKHDPRVEAPALSDDAYASAELNRRIMEAMPGGIVHVSAERGILRANAEALRILGLSYDALTQRYTQDFATYTIWEDGSPCAPEDYPVNRALATGVTQPAATIGVRKPDGHVSWAIFTAVPVLAPDGGVAGAVCTFLDITARREMEAQLRDSEARLRSIVESAPAFVVTVDPELHITYINRVIAGLHKETVMGRNVLDLVAEADRARTHGALASVFATGSVQTLEVHTDKGLGDSTYRMTAGPVRYGDEIRAVTIVAEDITGQKEMEARLLLADRLTAIGTLAAGVAHEINNPLTYLLGNLELLTRRFQDSESLSATRLREALEGAERIREVVRDLVTFSHRDKDLQGPVRVSEAIEHAVRMAHHEIRHRARLVRDDAGAHVIRGSAARLSQVLLNLLVNAAHAIPPGHVDENEVRISTRVIPGERVRITVSDTGEGIDRTLVGRIFDPFVTTKPMGQGTGLGLYVCHNIVQSLGGTIWVESQLERGTKFHVDLPLSQSGRPPAPDAQPRAVVGPKGLHILLVDDEPAVRAFVQGTLSQHEVACVSSGRDAIAAIDARKFDVVLCDLMMPDLTGLDVYAHARKAAPELARRFLFVTGASVPNEAAGTPSLGAPVLQKPFGIEELEQALANLMS
jgi:two-component system cell cycle sensor histidine kinase/response regulator CckA